MRWIVSRRALFLMLSCLVLATLTSCGYRLTGTGGSLPAHIKTIAVPALSNGTTRPELAQRITEAIVEQLVARGKYTIVPDAANADAVLVGSIDSWSTRPVELSADRSSAQRVSVTLRANVRFDDLVTDRLIWKQDGYAFTAEYEIIGDPDAYFDTELGAVDEVAEDFARAVVSAILQGF